MASKPPQNHSKPTSSNWWDVPAPDPVGSPSASVIYHSVGAALSAWEELEEALAELFWTFTLSQSLAAKAAYGAAVAHGARQDMLAAAAEWYFLERKGDPLQNRKLLIEIGKLSGRRNEIAHGLCNYEEGPLLYGYYLRPPYYATNKHRDYMRILKFNYHGPQIDFFRDAFIQYRVNVKNMNASFEE